MTITPLYLTGFEHGAASALGTGLFDNVTGAATVATTAPRNGSYHGVITDPGSAATNFGKLVVGSPNKLVVRFGLRMVTLPASATPTLFGMVNASQNGAWLVINSSGALFLSVGSGGNRATGVTITTGTWHLIELQLDISANPWVMNYKIDGVAGTQITDPTALSTFANVYCGTTNGSDPAFTAYYDDLIFGSYTVAATDWWGNGQVLAQLAGSDGTHATVADFSPGDAGTIYSGTVTTANTMVSDAPASGGWTTTRSTTNNIAMRVVNTAGYMEIAPATTAQLGLANAVRALLSYSSPTATANAAGCVARNSAGTVAVLNGTVGGTLATYAVTTNNFKGALLAVPAAGWTAAEVNAVRFRFGGGTASVITNVPTVQAMMLEVDWPVTAAPSVLLASQHHRHPGAAMQRRSAEVSRGRF